MNKNKKIALLFLFPTIFLTSSCGGYPRSYVMTPLPFDMNDCVSLALIVNEDFPNSTHYLSNFYYTTDNNTIEECYESVSTCPHSTNLRKNLSLFKIIGKTYSYSDFRFYLSDGSTYRFVATEQYLFYDDGSIYKYSNLHNEMYIVKFDYLHYECNFDYFQTWEF